MKAMFLMTIICEDKGNLHASSILFDSFDEALSCARKDAEYYKHLCNEYEEKIGTWKRRANITMKGKYISKKYVISKMEYDRILSINELRPTTCPVVDFLPDGMML